MQPLVPNLCKSDCRFVSMCGWVATDNADLLAWIDKHNDKLYDYSLQLGEDSIYAQFSLDKDDDEDEDESSVHFHINLATPSFFPDDERPEPDADAPDFYETISKFLGMGCRLHLIGKFYLDLPRLPNIIKITQQFTAKADEMTLTMTGGELRVEGGVVEKIHWKIHEKRKIATLDLKADLELEITPDYLANNFAVLTKAFTAIIQDDSANE